MEVGGETDPERGRLPEGLGQEDLVPCNPDALDAKPAGESSRPIGRCREALEALPSPTIPRKVANQRFRLLEASR